MSQREREGARCPSSSGVIPAEQVFEFLKSLSERCQLCAIGTDADGEKFHIVMTPGFNATAGDDEEWVREATFPTRFAYAGGFQLDMTAGKITWALTVARHMPCKALRRMASELEKWFACPCGDGDASAKIRGAKFVAPDDKGAQTHIGGYLPASGPFNTKTVVLIGNGNAVYAYKTRVLVCSPYFDNTRSVAPLHDFGGEKHIVALYVVPSTSHFAAHDVKVTLQDGGERRIAMAYDLGSKRFIPIGKPKRVYTRRNGVVQSSRIATP